MNMRILLIFVLAAWGATNAAAQVSVQRGEPQRVGDNWEERAECSAPMRQASLLIVRAGQGTIRVNPGPGETMTCRVRLVAYRLNETEARRQFRNYELSLRPHDGGLILRSTGSPPRGRHRSSVASEFDITVPARSNLDLETQGGEISIGNLQGSIQAVTAGGDIRVADIKGPLRLETAGGSIRVGSVTGPVEARTAGGSIHLGDVIGSAVLETSGGEIISGMVSGNLRAETAGGDLVLRGATGAIEAQTAGGQIRIGETGGSVLAQTAGGSIRLNGARGRVDVKTAAGSLDLLQLRNAVRASTAAGSIVAQVDKDLKALPTSSLETAAGDVRVYLPPGLPLNIDAVIEMAAGHRIVSDFPLNIQGEGTDFAPTKVRGAGALNGGGEVLRIRTAVGNIEIRKLDAQTLERLQAQQEAYWKRWKEAEEREMAGPRRR